ncbi:IS200/IS605 family transposase [Thermochromatium tepidum]|uniref:IS200/IS605 family transposase n=1 Tax=Thermochromatium tepidum ATCC 43061 TaxID=316276 RepID=A0A6I6E859_THETI|nr:IS200/IS605 family transposase [Thermochromatium tepidum]QGU32843.1 IS200/IS605 family transposase [Thermochromatium tepidum ATCC 43061]
MVDIVTNRNCVYQTAYHVIWCPKYRHDILTGLVAEEMGAMLDAICAERGWPMISKEIQPDHVHLFVSIPPALAVADAVKILKGTTARKLFQRFPWLKNRLLDGHLWSPSYYVGTAGNVSAETIRRYIERSEHVTKRR